MIPSCPAPCAAQNVAGVDIHPPQDDCYPQNRHEVFQQSGLSERVDQSLRFRVLSGLITIAWYTCFYGADLVGATVDSCTRYQASGTVSRGRSMHQRHAQDCRGLQCGWHTWIQIGHSVRCTGHWESIARRQLFTKNIDRDQMLGQISIVPITKFGQTIPQARWHNSWITQST